MSSAMPDASALSTPLAWARAYAAIGWHVLPLEPGQKQPMGRLVPRGMLDATVDDEKISEWWRRAPSAGIGIALAPSGLVALDIDPRNGGTETFDELQTAHGSLRSEVMAFTGGGGEHHVFVVPHGHQVHLPGTLGPGVDVKANGYIVVEPSRHPSGNAYGWEASSNPLDGVAPSPLPDWLRSLRVKLAPAGEPKAGDVPVDPVKSREIREALYMLDADDYDEWIKAGMALHSTRWGHPAYAMWSAWSQQSDKFDATVCRKKWETFREDRTASGISAAWVFSAAQARGWINPAQRIAKEAHRAPQERIKQDETAQGIPVLDLAALEASSQAVTWLVKHVIPAESVGVMFGGSGTFKSFIALDAALHIAHGMPWMGRRTKKGAVLYIAAEGGAGLWRRVKAWHAMHGLDWAGIDFYVVPVAVDVLSQSFEVLEAARGVGVEPAFVVVDTLSQTFSGEENSAAEVSKYLREIGLVFRATWKAAVVVIHHSGHQATERPRGSSALRANTDFMLGVFRDEQQMLATVECHKQKDGELFEAVNFGLHVEELGRDEDGDKVTSLVASEIRDQAAVLEVMQHEAARGRGGKNQLLVSLICNGAPERELRKAFYDSCEIENADSRRQAYFRALNWAKKAGLIEVAHGTVIALKA